MESKREAIVNLHSAGKSNAVISKSLCVARSTVKRFNEWGDFCNHQRSGRPHSQQHASMIEAIQERILRNPRWTIRKTVKDTEMSPRTMGHLIHEELRMSSFTLQKRQSLSMIVEQKRLERSKVLLNELKSHNWWQIVQSGQMRKFLLLSKHIIAKMIALLAKIMLTFLMKRKQFTEQWNLHPSWYGQQFRKLRGPLSFLLKKRSKIMQKCTLTRFRPLCWNLQKIPLVMAPCGHFSKKKPLPTLLTSLKTGAGTIFPNSGLKKEEIGDFFRCQLI